MPAWRSWLLHLALFLALAALPLLSLLGAEPGAFLAHPGSELPVRLWGIQTYPDVGLLGGFVSTIGHPHPGPLNNPDVVGTVVVGLLRPLLGLAGAWNALVVLLLWANMVATWALLRAWLGEPVAAVTGALGVGFMPLALSYGLSSAIVDTLGIWPYPLGLLALLQVSRNRRPGLWGAAAGLAAALAVVSSPYTFVVAFSGLPVAALVLAPGLPRRLRDRAFRARWGVGLFALALVGGVLVGAYALHLRSLMSAPGSLMSSEYVALTRNSPPWDSLRPGHLGQFVAPLAEYLAIGKAALAERDTASHYARTVALTSTLFALALVGALADRRARPWAVVALVAALASTGPFLVLAPDLAFDQPVNPFFLFVHYVAPGGRMLLETFRYGGLAGFATAMAAAVGVAWLRRRGGALAVVGALAPVAFLVDLALLSPVPVPLPVARLEVSPAYARLDDVLPPGPIVELPHSDGDTGRFTRIQFFHQQVHRRPIANVVRGYPPDLLLDNDLLRALLAAEILVDPVTPDSRLPPGRHGPGAHGGPYRRLRFDERPGSDPVAGRAELVRAGFVGIVIDPSAYTSEASRQRVRELLGPDLVTVEDRWVLPLTVDSQPR